MVYQTNISHGQLQTLYDVSRKVNSELDLDKLLDDIMDEAIELCGEKGDGGTRRLLEGILTGEEESVDWLEAQLHIIDEIGKERYIAQQLD